MNQQAFAELIAHMDEDLLREAIIAYGERNEGFRQQFMTRHSAEEPPERTAAGPIIMKVVRDIPASANGNAISNHTRNFKKVKQLMGKEKYSEMLDLVFANMDELAASRALPDDEDEEIVEAIDEYFDLLREFYSACFDDDLILQLGKYAISQMENPAFDLNDHITHWINIAALVIRGGKEEVELLDKLGKMDAQAVSDGNWEAVVAIGYARRLAEDLSVILPDDSENEEYDEDEDDDDDVSQEKIIDAQIAAAKARKDYPEARRLMVEDLERSKKTREHFRYETTAYELISLLKDSSADVLELRKLAQSFYEETGRVKFYQAMKDSYVGSEWEPLGKAWVARLESNLPAYIKGEADPSPLIDLYLIEYPDGDKLFKLLEQVKNLRLLIQCEDLFDEEYYSKLSRLYSRLIKDYASRGSSPAANRLIYSSLLRLRELDEGGITNKVLAALNRSYPDKDILRMMKERLDLDL